MAKPQTVRLSPAPVVAACANLGGKHESRGPLHAFFDRLEPDAYFGKKTYEQAEAAMQAAVLAAALEKAALGPEDLDCVFGGDLLNQCIGTTFALRNVPVPLYGLYSACATMGEALSLAALMISAGFLDRAAALTSSHFCCAERQYRMPLPYGSQRHPTAQWTATAAGCALLAREGTGPRITHVTRGRVVDKGVADPNNMGAAMARAELDTLRAFFRDTA